MPSYTPNFNLYKPSRMDNEEVDTTLAQNFESIDTELKNQSDAMATHKNAPEAHGAESITFEYDGAPSTVKNALDNMSQRINNIIENSGDSNPEIVDARGEFPILSMRLQDTESQLADIDLNTVKKTDFDNHAGDKDNPHEVTAGQVGAYTREESDGRFPALTTTGMLTIPNQTYFFASTGVDLAITNGVDTKITMGASSGDQHSEFANGIWTVKETGVYLVSVVVRWMSVVNGIGTFKLYSGGSSILDMFLGSHAKFMAFGRPVKFSAGTQLIPYLNQDSGTGATMDHIYMYIAKIS